MMKTIAVLLLVFVINCFFAQENYKIYSWESAQKLGKDTVYGITFSKTKFDSIPSDLINPKKVILMRNTNRPEIGLNVINKENSKLISMIVKVN